jgi:hypothetical protein
VRERVETYRAQTGRRFDLRGLSPREREVLDEVRRRYEAAPAWQAFARAWPRLARRAWGDEVPVGSTLYRVCQDLELRLGVAEGRLPTIATSSPT